MGRDVFCSFGYYSAGAEGAKGTLGARGSLGAFGVSGVPGTLDERGAMGSLGVPTSSQAAAEAANGVSIIAETTIDIAFFISLRVEPLVMSTFVCNPPSDCSRLFPDARDNPVNVVSLYAKKHESQRVCTICHRSEWIAW